MCFFPLFIHSPNAWNWALTIYFGQCKDKDMGTAAFQGIPWWVSEATMQHLHVQQSYSTCMGSNYASLACEAIMYLSHVQQSYITWMCSNYASLVCAAIIHHSHVQQSCISHLCNNHTSLECAAIMHYLCVQQSYITYASRSLCLKAPQLATQAAAEWFLSVPREAKVSLSQTVLQHTLLDLFSLERCLKRGLCCQASAMRLWILFWASYELSPRNVAVSLQSGGWFEFRHRGVCACVRACVSAHTCTWLVLLFEMAVHYSPGHSWYDL